MTTPYDHIQPSREAIDRSGGPMLLQFGTNWCGYCIAAEPLIAAALASRPGLPQLKVEDGPGRPLGRSFRVKLWPTLVFLQDAREVARVVRPRSEQQIVEALARLQPAPDPASSRR